LRFKSFADAFTGDSTTLIAANDNKPAPKPRSAHYRGTLPALRWLYENHPELAPALARAIPKPATSWSQDVVEATQEIRPTIGELMKAASDAFRVFLRDGVRHVGKGLQINPKTKDAAAERVSLGSLKFQAGRLVEWSVTKKGHRLRPLDRLRGAEKDTSASRNPRRYLATNPTTRSPMEARHLHRPISHEPALAPMYDPQAGVEDARELLRRLGVDGAVRFEHLPCAATKGVTAVAHGAGFLDGVSRSSGNSSSGAVLWEMPEKPKGEITIIVEEVAARGTLKSIGLRLGYSGTYADRAGKAALIEAAKTLTAMNDNKKFEGDVPLRVAV
jgi:hypothetical protein